MSVVAASDTSCQHAVNAASVGTQCIDVILTCCELKQPNELRGCWPGLHAHSQLQEEHHNAAAHTPKAQSYHALVCKARHQLVARAEGYCAHQTQNHDQQQQRPAQVKDQLFTVTQLRHKPEHEARGYMFDMYPIQAKNRASSKEWK